MNSMKLNRRVIGIAVTVAAASLMSACAPYRAEVPSTNRSQDRSVVNPQSRPDGSIVNPPRSSSGNPPFYEVFGQRYYVLDTSDGYRERGIASWYGRDFHGKRTSGGERYDMHAMTAAHKTLPIPTWVEVTNLSNGKSVTVLINDRGPFVDGRIIDLSYRAATELDIIGAGTARVQVRALGTPQSARPAITTAATAEPPRSGGISIISEAQADTPRPGDRPLQQLFIQVGAFAEHGNALNFVARLKRSGFDDAFIVSSGTGRDQIHRVQIGPLANTAQFDRVSRDLRSIGVSDSRLVAGN